MIIVDENWLSDKELDQMIGNAERYNEDDHEKIKRFSARNDLEIYCRDLQSSLERVNNHHENKNHLIEKCKQVIQWLNDTSRTEKEMKDKEEDIKTTIIEVMKVEAATNPSRDESLSCGSSQQDNNFG